MWYQIHHDGLILIPIIMKLERPDVILQLIVSDNTEPKSDTHLQTSGPYMCLGHLL